MAGSAVQGNGTLKVLLADDHPNILEMGKRLLGSDYQVVGAITNGLLALEAAKELNPDLIVLDIHMPEMDGFRTAQELRRLGMKARIIFLTVEYSPDFVAVARELGHGYVLKLQMATDLHKAIEESLAGRFFASTL